MHTKEDMFRDSEIPFRIHDARGNLDSGYLHYHDCLEVNYVLGGSGINYIDGRRYEMSRGDLYLINNYEHHFAGAQNGLSMKVMYFDPGFIWDHAPENYALVQAFYSRNLPDGNRLRLSERENEQVCMLLAQLEQEYCEKAPGYRLFLKAKLTELLALLYRATHDLFDCTAIKDYQAYEKLLPALRYIQSNPEEELTLQKLSELACMSRTYFCSYFRQTMSMNVSDYIEQVRIRKAQLLLTTTAMPVTEVCYACGYRSISSFHTAFRKLCDLTPGQFRRRHTAQTES